MALRQKFTVIFSLRRSASPDSLERLFPWWENWFSCRNLIMPIKGKKSAQTWTSWKKMESSRLQAAVMCDSTALLLIAGAEALREPLSLRRSLGTAPACHDPRAVCPPGLSVLLMPLSHPGLASVPGLGMSPVSPGHTAPDWVWESRVVPSSLAIILQDSLTSLPEATEALNLKILMVATEMWWKIYG